MLIHGSGSVVCSNRCVDYNNGIYCITKKNVVNSIQQSIDTLLYVINFENNQGYAIVSAVDGQEHLLAITEQGHYTPQQKSVYEGVDLFIERAAKYVENQRVVSLRDTIVYVFPMSINPRVPVSWGQDNNYALFTENGKAGCASTAVAMTMCTFQHPTILPLTYPMTIDSLRPSQITLEWDTLYKYKNSVYCYVSNKDSTETVISRLMRQLGHQMNSTYYPNTTSTNLAAVPTVLASYGYTVSTISNYTLLTPLYQILQDSAIILMSGHRTNIQQNDSTDFAHMWIIDGYKQYDINLQTDPFLPKAFPPFIIHATMYYHVNWGWDGDSNGYFEAGVFDTQQAYEYDDEIPGITQNKYYNTELKYFSVKWQGT